jgi:hypothetical protein
MVGAATGIERLRIKGCQRNSGFPYLRLALCATGIALVRYLPLEPLRHLTSAEILKISSLLGMQNRRLGSTTLLYHGEIHEFTRACTFVDPFIVVVVLGWRLQRPRAANLGFCAMMVALLTSLNVARVEMNFLLLAEGFPRWIYHGLSDGLSYAAAVVPGLRNLIQI